MLQPSVGHIVALVPAGVAAALLIGLILRKSLDMAPTEVEIGGSSMLVRVRGIDKLAAFKSRLEVPLSYVVSAEAAGPELMRQWRWALRYPGTALPGVIRADTYYKKDERASWDVYDPDKAVMIRLRDEGYDRLVIEVENPAATLAAIQETIDRRIGSAVIVVKSVKA
ncbi:MAG: hypothetical protein JOZ19_00550 [Rubrobacter sp.]|nr:hypothetical protein [Rubrobacter sp.]